MKRLNRTVLIVDDDDEWRAIAADFLAEAGFSVTTASDGRAGLASWRRTRARVVLTDGAMPMMDGCELVAALHAIDRSLPVLVLTGEDVSDAPSAFPGAFRVIQKPAPIDTIISAVTQALSCRRLPPSRRIACAARAVISFGRVRGQAAVSRAANLLGPQRTTQQPASLKRRKRARTRLGVAAGFGAAAVAAVLIAAIRSSVM